jgi:hypothetical protein
LLIFKYIFILFVRYEFIVAVNMKFIISWCVTPCRLANLPRLYGVTYYRMVHFKVAVSVAQPRQLREDTKPFFVTASPSVDANTRTPN